MRHAFDQFEITYDLIYKERVRKGNLRGSYDVIVIPNQGRGSAKSLVFDVESKGKPSDYKRSGEFKSLGEYGESDDITGGMGLPGAEELNKFVQDGGVLITLGASSFFPAEFGLVRAGGCGAALAGLLRSGSDCGSRGDEAHSPDLLRLFGEEAAGALREWPAIARSD